MKDLCNRCGGSHSVTFQWRGGVRKWHSARPIARTPHLERARKAIDALSPYELRDIEAYILAKRGAA